MTPNQHIDLGDEHLPHAFVREMDDDNRLSARCAKCRKHALDPIHAVPVGDDPFTRHGPFGE